MKVFEEMSLQNFEFWSGAKCNACLLTSEELNQFGEELETLYPEGVESTQINDIFWFDFEWVCECLGLDYDTEKGIINR